MTLLIQTKPWINSKDINLLVSSIYYIVHHDFEKINKLMKYLRSVATVCSLLGLPIIWSLANGLVVRQSYLETKSTSIRPFLHSKVKMNLQVTDKWTLDKSKQIRALMPNLIHSLDATSLTLLHREFSEVYGDINPQFLAIHDCFGTTMEKVETLKTILTSVYTEIYVSDSYLDKFDKNIVDYIYNSGKNINKDTRIVEIIVKDKVQQYELHNIEWVQNKKIINK